MKLMGNLEDYLHDISPTPVLIKTGLAHAQFETVHPFLDGNGRIGRLLITFYLYQQGTLRRPLLYLSDFFRDHRQAYYDKLNAFREKDDIEGDIALVKAGYEARNKMGKLSEKRGIEVGNIFQLGYHYSNEMKDAIYIDVDGKEKPFYMGCYGIGIGRTMAAIVEKHHDDKGIVWPEPIAPFSIHLVALDGVGVEADKLYYEMAKKGTEVLYDDRDKTAGEKFADADLIGIPTRVVVSKKTVQQKSVELKNRKETKTNLVTIEDFISMF